MASKKHSNSGQPPKTPEQLEAAAEASAQYRLNQTAKGIPDGRTIDRESAKLLFGLAMRRIGLHLTPERLVSFRDHLIRFGEWNATDDVRAAVDKRIRILAGLEPKGGQPHPNADDSAQHVA